MEASTELILGGQGMYVQLRSSNVSYDASTQIFRADVTVQNLTALNLGTPDGSTVTGVKVFFHSGPTVTSGAGTVTVANADGTGTFTGTDQPYFLYNEILPTGQVSSGKTWQWSVPSTVAFFTFQVLVDAAVQDFFVLTVSVLGGGTVTSAPMGISCSAGNGGLCVETVRWHSHPSLQYRSPEAARSPRLRRESTVPAGIAGCAARPFCSVRR